MRNHALIGLACLAACSDPTGTHPDASIAVDASIDAVPDANLTCPAGQLCLQMMPVDGVTTLPAGRLAIAWLDETGTTIEVAYDRPWTPASLTIVDLSQIALPTAAVQRAAAFCNNAMFAPGFALLSTDPDGSGSISAAEIQNGRADHTMYGVHREMVAWMAMGCPANLPDFPEGFMAGVHVYTEASPVHQLDGMITQMETCQPLTVGCDNLMNPL